MKFTKEFISLKNFRVKKKFTMLKISKNNLKKKDEGSMNYFAISLNALASYKI